MVFLKSGLLTLSADFEKGTVESLKTAGKELICEKAPIFRIAYRTEDGELKRITAWDAAVKKEESGSGVYAGFEVPLSVKLTAGVTPYDMIDWRIFVENGGKGMVEWAEYPCFTVKPLRENGGDGEILYPYNEGSIVSDIHRHPEREPEYPSVSACDVFPNMVCSQFMCYLTEGNGLYFAAHDETRTVKEISFYEDRSGAALQIRQYCGADYGENFESSYPTVLCGFTGGWEAGAAVYRDWFEKHLPGGLKKISESVLPAWYKDSPLVISYPVRGIHDMDEMKPNALFPYTNALPLIRGIREKTGSKLLVLLMHWEGSAPWAPPYVWPPYGGEKCFNDFADALHEEGDLLGVYCSGFGYTIQSNLIDEYNCEEKFEKEERIRQMCTGPKGELDSTICTGQRKGYDICVQAPGARVLLQEAYGPLFESRVDYAQILDQNHGGGQYFCYSREHGHVPGPGKWMTESMSALLENWNRLGEGKLFGCESAAGEPYIPYLRFSDNRYELNFIYGRPVPLYAFLYHEYLRNFMGNQVSCGLSDSEDTLRYRMAYSFAAGDCMTLVFRPDGSLFHDWGNHDFSRPAPDLRKTLEFAGNMHDFYEKEAGEFLYDARMIAPERIGCATVTFHRKNDHSAYPVPAVVTTAWEKEGRKVQILINHTDEKQTVSVKGVKVEIEARSGKMIDLLQSP